MTINRRQFTKWCGLTALAATTGCTSQSSNEDGGGFADADPNAPDADPRAPDAYPAPDADPNAPDAAPGSIADNRVVRVHSADAHDWDFVNVAGSRHYDHINAGVVAAMLDRGLRDLTDDATAESAWRTIMRHHNPAGYQSGDKIAIKINNNNNYVDSNGQPNTNPEIINAVIAGLVSIGAAESDITLYDAVRGSVPRQRTGVLAAHPGVSFVAAYDGITWDNGVQVNFASFAAQRLPTVVTQCDHLINIHLFKAHRTGITGAMKNHFGTIEDPNTLHSALTDGPVLAEINSHPHIKDKTRLLVTEALFGNSLDEEQPPVEFNNTNVFPGGSPNSIFLSANPVCLDSVLYDYIGAEDAYNGTYHGPDTWLHLAANDFGLGIHEHGNLGTGIYSNQDFTYQQIDYRNRSLTG